MRQATFILGLDPESADFNEDETRLRRLRESTFIAHTQQRYFFPSVVRLCISSS